MKNVMMEEYMEQNPPVQDQSFKSDREPEEEAEDATFGLMKKIAGKTWKII